MLNPTTLKEAQERAMLKTKELLEKKPLTLPQDLATVRLKRLKEKELEIVAPKTGYMELDLLIKGFIPGHLYTLTGETNVGKSSLAANFSVRVAKQPNRSVLYVALEPDTTIIDYLASAYHDKRFDELTEDDLDLSGMNIDVLGKEGVDSVERMVELIENYNRYDLIVIDHIGYFITSQNNWIQQQSNAIKKLVSVAKKKLCAVMIIAHLRKRAKNDKKDYVPTSDDISGSGAFKQDSTEVMIATRTLDPNDADRLTYTNKGKLFITKTKAGPNGVIDLTFSEKSARIDSDIDMEVKKGLSVEKASENLTVENMSVDDIENVFN